MVSAHFFFVAGREKILGVQNGQKWERTIRSGRLLAKLGPEVALFSPVGDFARFWAFPIGCRALSLSVRK